MDDAAARELAMFRRYLESGGRRTHGSWQAYKLAHAYHGPKQRPQHFGSTHPGAIIREEL